MQAQRSSDKEIVLRIIRKDERTLHKLYTTYHNQLCGFIFKRIPQKGIAEEITQDVFIEFLESLRDFRFQCSLKTFLYTIARNKTIDYMRKKKLKRILFSHLPAFVVEGLSAISIDDQIERTELQERLEETLNGLPHDYRMILRLKYIEEKSVKDISLQLVKTFKSTESLLYRARQAFINRYSRGS